MGSKKLAQAPGIDRGPTASDPSDRPSNATVAHKQSARFGPMEAPQLHFFTWPTDRLAYMAREKDYLIFVIIPSGAGGR